MIERLRKLFAYLILLVFVLFFLFSGGHYESLNLSPGQSFPDFSHHRSLRTLTEREFPINGGERRVILVGDIHGMIQPLHLLLDKLSYDPTSDTLIHVGDLVAKGPFEGSLQVLSFMTAHNIIGVRGNHDQKVIEWRAWLDWVSEQPGGTLWLERMHDAWEAEKDSSSLETWVAKERTKRGPDRQWWALVPSGWQFLGPHYLLARSADKAAHEYLRSLPLTLFIPHIHAFIAHAGLLPVDPSLPPWHKQQPLARAPYLPGGSRGGVAFLSRQRLMRRLQEEAILEKIAPNKDPWVVLNMRGVKKDLSITRGHGGTPWAELWNAYMWRCSGYEVQPLNEHSEKSASLPCSPSTVVYGHASRRGLDLKRWSMGLDTGCVYGKRLTALVFNEVKDTGKRSDGADDDADEISGDQVDDADAEARGQIPFGDEAAARIVSVSCH